MHVNHEDEMFTFGFEDWIALELGEEEAERLAEFILENIGVEEEE